MRTYNSIVKGLLPAGALALSLMASAGTPYPFQQAYPFRKWSEQYSRWVARPLEGVDGWMASSADGTVLVAMRREADSIRSFDAGATWDSFTIQGQRAGGVAFAPSDSRTWYAGAEGGFYVTRDGGTTWDKRAPALASPYGRGWFEVSADPNVVYGLQVEADLECDFNECPYKSTVLQISTDAGATWRDLPLTQAFGLAFPSPLDPNLVISAGSSGIFRSSNQGGSWEPLALPLAGYGTSGRVFWDRLDAGIAYYVPYSYGEPSVVFSTRDRGTTWKWAALPGGKLIPDPAQKGRAFLFADFGGAYETRDAGTSWVRVETGGYTSIDSDVDAVVLRGSKRYAVNAFFSTLRELPLSDGALALTSDLWWNPDESGWGLTITHRWTNQTFVAWYGYDKDGAPVWRVVPGGQWNDRTFTGDLYEATAAPYFGASFDPSKVVPKKVGTARIVFDSEGSAVFSYQIGSGESANKRIVRQLFGPAVTWPVVEESYADLWWNASESGWGIAINHQNDNIFATWFAYDAQGKPLWVVMPDAKVVLTGEVPKATGDIYTTRGPSSSGPFDPSQVVATKVGTASITFTTADSATLEYTAFGTTGSKAITRQPF